MYKELINPNEQIIKEFDEDNKGHEFIITDLRFYHFNHINKTAAIINKKDITGISYTLIPQQKSIIPLISLFISILGILLGTLIESAFNILTAFGVITLIASLLVNFLYKTYSFNIYFGGNTFNVECEINEAEFNEIKNLIILP